MTVTDREVLEELELDMPGVLEWARDAERRVVRETEESK